MHKETQPSQTQENLLTLLESIPNKQTHIQESIIPRMNKRRGRKNPMSSEKVINNILGLPPEKPGEAYELKISQKMADSFCILKYEVRLKHGDQENHKQIENRALHIYLQSFNQTSG